MEKVFKVIRLICYLTCFGLFLVWLGNAMKSYLAMPKTTNVSLKYGDDNKKNASFPSITFCKGPFGRFEEGGMTMMVWNNNTACSKNSRLEKPYFLSYIEDCLESGNNETVSELVNKVTYNPNEVFVNINTRPEGSSPLKNGNEWKDFQDRIILSNYHYNYGNCLTVDISSLSQNGILFPMQYQSHDFKLQITFYRVDPIVLQFYFIHNGTNINLLGADNKGSAFSGGHYGVRL